MDYPAWAASHMQGFISEAPKLGRDSSLLLRTSNVEENEGAPRGPKFPQEHGFRGRAQEGLLSPRDPGQRPGWGQPGLVSPWPWPPLSNV